MFLIPDIRAGFNHRRGKGSRTDQRIVVHIHRHPVSVVVLAESDGERLVGEVGVLQRLIFQQHRPVLQHDPAVDRIQRHIQRIILAGERGVKGEIGRGGQQHSDDRLGLLIAHIGKIKGQSVQRKGLGEAGTHRRTGEFGLKMETVAQIGGLIPPRRAPPAGGLVAVDDLVRLVRDKPHRTCPGVRRHPWDRRNNAQHQGDRQDRRQQCREPLFGSAHDLPSKFSKLYARLTPSVRSPPPSAPADPFGEHIP